MIQYTYYNDENVQCPVPITRARQGYGTYTIITPFSLLNTNN